MKYAASSLSVRTKTCTPFVRSMTDAAISACAEPMVPAICTRAESRLQAFGDARDARVVAVEGEEVGEGGDLGH